MKYNELKYLTAHNAHAAPGNKAEMRGEELKAGGAGCQIAARQKGGRSLAGLTHFWK